MATGKTYLTGQKYFKPNYFEALKYILPEFLTEDDTDNFGKHDDLRDQIINDNILLANNLNDFMSISSVENTVYSDIDTLEGITPFFVKQNNLTNITSERFEDKILKPLGKSLVSYETSGEFANYISGTLLPSIVLNSPTAQFEDSQVPSAAHNYLIENLSWMYFLNTTGISYDPSNFVANELVNKIYRGNPIQLKDGIKGLMEFVWRNEHTEYFPSDFVSSTDSYLSGTQQLDKLKTWVDIIYSPLQADKSDFTVREKFEQYIDSTLLTSTKIAAGPFTKFLRALSFFAYDINNDSERLATLYDIDECPDEFLPLLAELIGWDLFGNDPSRWRLQLRNAVDIYKAAGTKKALQFAVNSVLPKGQFDIQTKVNEMHESYVPFLIYYALATDSTYFKTNNDWTPTLATDMGVSGFDPTSQDENLKLVVDKILLETYERFSDRFGDLPNQEKGFTFRGRTYPIPPFEEYPYYANFELNKEIIEFMEDRLICYGCSVDFANKFNTYLTDNALNVDDEVRNSSFLLFTSGYNEAPNLASLVASSFDNKFEYASLWSGKSSHFKVVLDASSFDFTSDSLEASSTGESFLVASKIAKGFAPAHSIPLINLEISYEDTVASAEVSSLPIISPNRVEIDPSPARNYEISGYEFNSYLRDYRTEGQDLGRIETTVDPQLLNATGLTDIPRTSLRRRSYEKVIPMAGYYDRTGFNMPTSFEMTENLSGFPLGYIPSSHAFEPVADHVNLPDVWRSCEGVSSSDNYYGYDVSNALLARGAWSIKNDRCQLPEIYAVMHGIKERVKLQQASATYGPVDSWTDSVSNVYQSYANSATENNGEFPNSTQDYYSYSFGRDLHRLYRIYTTEFEWHAMAPWQQDVDGANIFSHTFGPTLFNHDFEVLGADSSVNDLVASSLSSTAGLTQISDAFSGDLAYTATGANDMYLDTFEKVLSGAVSGVELVHTSGIAYDNSFSIFRVNSIFKSTTEDPYLYDNTLILSRALAGLSRIRFDISKYAATPDRSIATNFLLPDHNHQVKVRALVSDDVGVNFGGRVAGVWIHTKPESGMMWSYDANGVWTQHAALPSREDVMVKYSHRLQFDQRVREQRPSEIRRYPCSELTLTTRTASSPVGRLRREDFDEFTIDFNTRNRDILLPKDYRVNHSLLHRKNQNYVVEVFLYPNGSDKEFLLLDSVTIHNQTLKKLSEIYVNGTYQDPLCHIPEIVGNCSEYRVELTKDELRTIFRFFNNITGKNSATGLASRNKNETEAIMGTEGGSKLSYRYAKSFVPVTEVTNHSVIDSISIGS